MRFLISLTFIVIVAVSVRSQSPCDGVVMPAGTQCISQQAANAAAQLSRESVAKDAKIKTLESSLVEKDQIIAANHATADTNERELKAALNKTEIELASKTGQLIGCEASNVRNLAIIDVLLKNTRPKKIGLINF